MRRLFFNGNRLSGLVKLNNAEAFRVIHIVAEDGGAPAVFRVPYRRM